MIHSTQASLLSESALLLRTVVIGESAERTTIGKKSIDHGLQSVAHFFATVMSNRIAQFAAGQTTDLCELPRVKIKIEIIVAPNGVANHPDVQAEGKMVEGKPEERKTQ